MSNEARVESHVRVGLVSPAVVFLPLWVAAARREFGERGLAISAEVIGSTSGTTDALLEGRIDVAFATPDLALLDPDDVSILAGLADRPPLSFVCRPGLDSFADVVGARIGTTSMTEGTVNLIQVMLANHGLAYPGDYEFVLAGAHPQRWAALQDGTLDAALHLMPFDYLADEAGYPILGKAEDYVPHFAFSSACVRTTWAAAHPDVAESFASVLRAGEAAIREDEQMAATVASEKTGMSIEHVALCVDRLVGGGVMPADLTHSRDAVHCTVQAIRRLA
jgi:ABC-type nitrate/sulfonate/bicarbonate transport system substrate-binding protein